MPVAENTRSVLIFGGSGFIGTHLSRALIHSGARVVVVDRKRPAKSVDGVDYVLFDVRDLSGFSVPHKIDCIYNLAAVHTTPGHPVHEYYETNVLGANEITDFAQKHGVETIVFTSSISVYGAGEETKTEDTVPEPTSAYGWSKLLAERIHLSWLGRSSKNRLIVCRPAVIFGHGEGGNFSRLAKLLKKGYFPYPGRKDTIKACYYVGDLVSTIEDVLKYSYHSDERLVLFNGCYADRYTLEQIVEAFRPVISRQFRTAMIPRSLLSTAAAAARPFSILNLGIHPERITKLAVSTDVVPAWLERHDMARSERLPAVLQRWKEESNGSFE